MVSLLSSNPSSELKHPIGLRNYNFHFQSTNLPPSRLFRNEAFTNSKFSSPRNRRISYLKASKTLSKSMFDQQTTPRKAQPLRKHFITAPYGTIMKGKKLKQRHNIGGIFRENIMNDFKTIIIRNEKNMRTKYK
jgi:hypothetical protein